MKFWPSLKEAILELVFGHWQLEAWRAEDRQRKECEAACERMRKDAELLQSNPRF